MLYRCILTSLLFIATIAIVRATEANIFPTAETFSSHLKYQSDDVEEDDQHSVVVSRGNDILISTQTETGHYKEITVTLTAFNETFVLDLKLNTYLFASTYIEKAITDYGEVYNKVNHITGHCYYTGQVRNRSQSSAAVSTCKGITGYFDIGNVSYRIEPKSDHLYGRHRVFRNLNEAKTIFRCGTEKQLHWMSNSNSTASSDRFNHRMKRSFLYPQDRDRIDKVVEVYIANDNSQYLARSSNVDNVYSRTKNIVNTASLAYQAVGIYLVLVGVEVWTDRNRFTIQASDVNGALNNWYNYRKNSINPIHYNDNAILINNVTFYGGVVGKAVIGSMCSNLYSGSIVSDLSTSSAAAGAILAHEMGHNFGLQHDNSSSCSCDDNYTGNRCIMYPSSNSQRPATKWSTCSLNELATAFRKGVDICLYNIPQTIFQASAICGNGIVEDGEQCDCGNAPSNECNHTCCNTTTCQLTYSATCASGRCCDISRCQIMPSGTECRSKTNICDLAEFCNGVGPRCPADTYKPDGTDCTNTEAAHCYQGECRSHRSQCELIWGSGTQVSNDVCYTQFNVDGAHYGNCGFRWTNTSVEYIKCAAKDVKCGKLQCQDNSKSLYYYKNYYLLSSASIGSASCHSVIFDYGIGTQDPGLVPNGAKCGDRKLCVNQRCLDVSSVNTVPCASSCQPCEVCNNLGECQPTIANCPQSTKPTTPTTTTPIPTTVIQVPTSTSNPKTSTPNLSTVATVQTTLIVTIPAPTTSTPTLSTPTTTTPTTTTPTTTTPTTTTPTTTVHPPIISTPNSTTPQTPTTSVNAITVQLVLGIILGALVSVMAAVFLLYCSYKFFPGATARAPEDLVTTPAFTREALTPVQSRLRWIPAERYYSPQWTTHVP